jgi:hypothetical protein
MKVEWSNLETRSIALRGTGFDIRDRKVDWPNLETRFIAR